MGTNCAPFLADLFLYSYESEFLQKLVKDKKIELKNLKFSNSLSIDSNKNGDIKFCADDAFLE
jgi:hypothetical protein